MKNRTIVQASRIGAREHNEDRVAHWIAPEAVLLAVADGLGGHLHGELAAQLVIETLGACFQREAQPKLADPAQFFSRALGAGHAAILQETQKRRLPDSPRTVIVACVVQDGRAFWTHVGDCRFYLMRERRLLARSRDHTLVQQLVDEGRIPERAAASHPYRNRLLQCLGGYQTPLMEPVADAQLEKDDILLLCSDGLWGPLTDRQMVQSLASQPLGPAIAELIALAEAWAGPECDNVSVAAMTWNPEE